MGAGAARAVEPLVEPSESGFSAYGSRLTARAYPLVVMARLCHLVGSGEVPQTP